MKAASDNTKRQHTVPRVYLKRFGETPKKETFIYALDKTKEDVKPFKTNIINVCVETDYYTFKSLPDSHKRMLEHFFSKNIEDYYDEIYEIIVDPSITKIDEDTRFKIVSFCISQFFRTPKLSNSLNEFWKRIINFSFDMTESNPKIKIVDFGHKQIDTSITDRNEFIKEETQRNRELVNREAIKRIADFTIRRLDDGISVKRIDDKHKLITSDNPVFTSEHINYPDSFIRMPIDENHLLMLFPQNKFYNKNISRQTFDEEWSYIESTTNNVKQFESAERFVLGTKNGLEYFIKQNENFNMKSFEERLIKFENRMGNFLKYIEKFERK